MGVQAGSELPRLQKGRLEVTLCRRNGQQHGQKSPRLPSSGGLGRSSLHA